MTYDPTTLPQQLLDALATFDAAHRHHEGVDLSYRTADAQLTALKTELAAAITADKAFSNDTLRKAAAQRVLLEQHAEQVAYHAALETARQQAAAELERAAERLKTLRRMLDYETSANLLEAERNAADAASINACVVGGYVERREAAAQQEAPPPFTHRTAITATADLDEILF